MSREARVKSSINIYHIMLEGQDGVRILGDEVSKSYFEETMLALEAEREFELFAWCLMDNHVHLVVRISHENLGHAFRRLNIRFAKFFHEENGSNGHVFKGRFKSEAIEDMITLAETVRYVHVNPVNRQSVRNPSEYMWSSYSRYLCNRSVCMKEVWDMTGGNADGFKDYHMQTDIGIFLDIKKDLECQKEASAKKVITNICKQYDLTSLNEIFQQRDVFNETICEISRKSALSGRKIARIFNVNESVVRRIINSQSIQ